jgi:hypothetical protein
MKFGVAIFTGAWSDRDCYPDKSGLFYALLLGMTSNKNAKIQSEKQKFCF